MQNPKSRYNGVRTLGLDSCDDEIDDDVGQQGGAQDSDNIDNILNISFNDIFQDPDLPLLLPEDGEKPWDERSEMIRNPEAHKNLTHPKDGEQPEGKGVGGTPQAHKDLPHLGKVRVVNGIWVIETNPGEIQISEDEAELLNFQPNFQINEKLDNTSFETELGITGCKLRWELKRKQEDSEDKEAGLGCETEEEEAEQRIKDAEARRIFDVNNKTICMANRRVTDLDSNSKVYLPKALDALSEARIEVRNDQYRQIYAGYKKTGCNKEDKQEVNLPDNLKKALISLNKKIKEKQIVVVPTDKSGKFAICSLDAYKEMGMSNIKKDREISRKKSAQIQKQLNGHVASLNRCLNIGKNWNHEQRIFESTTSDSNLVPPGYILVKDHKEIEIGSLPGSRLVVSNCRGMGEPLSTLLSNLVESLALGLEDAFQVLSSEDLISKFEDYNSEVDNMVREQATPLNPP